MLSWPLEYMANILKTKFGLLLVNTLLTVLWVIELVINFSALNRFFSSYLLLFCNLLKANLFSLFLIFSIVNKSFMLQIYRVLELKGTLGQLAL